jgi:Holliday junction resolvasome RuvABC endonuclease subunit
MKEAIRIIGIDPGLRNTGWGVIDSLGNSLRFVASGTVKSDNKLDLASRLNQLYDGLERFCTSSSRSRRRSRIPSSTRTPRRR